MTVSADDAGPPSARSAVTTAIVLGYGKEEHLEDCLSALGSELRGGDELILVDNEIADGERRATGWPTSVKLAGVGHNLGFAGGCNFAAARAIGDVLVFVNSDAIVRPGAVSSLTAALADPTVGLACGCLRLADNPALVNSVGNPLQYLGITWAGHCGEPASAHSAPGTVAVATGGLCAIRREVWEELGGFDPIFFAYHEDTDLSIRCWLSGRRVRYVPEAVADHYYEFSRHPQKMYLVERNRLLTVLTDYPRPLLLAVTPMLVVTEPAFLALGVLQGWGAQKLRSLGWLLSHARTIARRRRAVQAGVTRDTTTLVEVMSSRIDPPMAEHPSGLGLINAALAAYWSVVRRILGTTRHWPARRSPKWTARAADDGSVTAGADYTDRLTRLESKGWKRLLDVQRPYRWNLQRLELGRVLDLGCGVGRNLAGLGPLGVGVDHNRTSVEVARARGLTVYTPQEFTQSRDATLGGYDALLVAHVLEHLDERHGDSLLREYLPYLGPGGRVVLITPQERGFRSDSSHVRFVDHSGLEGHAARLGLEIERKYSFPLPRAAGRIFAYNEFVLVARLPPEPQRPG